MQLQQAFEIPSAIERVWQSFKDVELVVGCLPGASLRAPPEDGRLQLAMAVKLGPITANFVGEGEARFDDATRSGTVDGAATDRKSASRIKGQVAFALSDVPASAVAATRVALTIDYTIGGALAQFSREGIVRDLAQRLTDAFAMNLRNRLEAASAEAAGGGALEASVDAANDAGAGSPSAIATGGTSEPIASAAASAGALADGTGHSVSPTGSATVTGAPSTGAPEIGAQPVPLAHSVANSAPPVAAPASLNLGALLWAALVDRVRRWLGRKPAR